MGIITKEIENAFNDVFKEFSMVKKSSKKIYSGYYEVIYTNNTTALVINYEEKEPRLSVNIYQLINGQIIYNPEYTNKWLQTKLYGFEINEILFYYDKNLCIRSFYEYSKSSEYKNYENDLFQYFCIYSTAVKNYCSSFLQGNFDKFDEIELSTKERVRELLK